MGFPKKSLPYHYHSEGADMRLKMFLRARRLSLKPSRLGASAVEFAIVAPVFILLVLGMVEVGRALMVQQVLINASRVGARTAVTLISTASETVAAAEDYAAGVGVSGVSVAVNPDPASAAAGTEVTVTTTVDFASVSWVPSPWFMGGKTLTATSVMRKEGF